MPRKARYEQSEGNGNRQSHDRGGGVPEGVTEAPIPALVRNRSRNRQNGDEDEKKPVRTDRKLGRERVVEPCDR